MYLEVVVESGKSFNEQVCSLVGELVSAGGWGLGGSAHEQSESPISAMCLSVIINMLMKQHPMPTIPQYFEMQISL